jgi:serine/threonine protein kinase
MQGDDMLVVGQQVDRYIIDGWVGEGGMATVYKAHHVELGTQHAIKVVNAISGDAVTRLRREGRTLGALQHPGIVSVTDFITVDGAPALVMELVDGPTLAHLIGQSRPTGALLEDLVLQLFEAVGAAHDAGLVHRDLKPANILLMPLPGGAYQLKVADFGLVKALMNSNPDSLKTVAGHLMGTPAYMAPEQAAQTTGPEADIWALGAILFELVTGTRAFQGPSLMGVLAAVSAGRYAEDALLAVDKGHANAIRSALKVDPKQRPHSCDELRRIWRGESPPVLPRPPATRWRTPLVVATIAALGLFAISSFLPAPEEVHDIEVISTSATRAGQALREADFDSAIRFAKSALEENPQDAFATLVLAEGQYFSEDQPAAHDTILAFRQQDGATDAASSALKIKADALRRFQVGEQIERHLERHPTDAVAVLSLTWINDRYFGRVFHGQKHGGSLHLAERVLNSEHDVPLAYLAAWKFSVSDRRQYLDRGLERHPTNLALLLSAAEHAILQGDVPWLATLTDRIAEHHPAQAVVDLQLIRAVLENDTQRRADLTKAVSLMPAQQRISTTLDVVESGCMAGQLDWTYTLLSGLSKMAESSGDLKLRAMAADVGWGCASFFEDIPAMRRYAQQNVELAAAPELDAVTKRTLQMAALYQPAMVAALTGDLETAQRNHDRLALVKDPNPTLAMEIQWRSGQLAEPIEAWGMPCFGSYSAGQVNFGAGFFDAARKQFDATLHGEAACAPGAFSIHAAAHAYLADIARQQGRQDTARLHAERALLLVPGGDVGLSSTRRARRVLSNLEGL